MNTHHVLGIKLDTKFFYNFLLKPEGGMVHGTVIILVPKVLQVCSFIRWLQNWKKFIKTWFDGLYQNYLTNHINGVYFCLLSMGIYTSYFRTNNIFINDILM